jgi:non-specific serine/threonine protein kinase
VGTTGSPAWRATALHNLGYVTYRQGDERQAAALLAEALVLCMELGDRRGMAECVASLGCVAARTRPERAARLLGAAMGTLDAAGPHLSRINRADYDHALAIARHRLGDGAFETAWRQGRVLTLEQAAMQALGDDPVRR